MKKIIILLLLFTLSCEKDNTLGNYDNGLSKLEHGKLDIELDLNRKEYWYDNATIPLNMNEEYAGKISHCYFKKDSLTIITLESVTVEFILAEPTKNIKNDIFEFEYNNDPYVNNVKIKYLSNNKNSLFFKIYYKK